MGLRTGRPMAPLDISPNSDEEEFVDAAVTIMGDIDVININTTAMKIDVERNVAVGGLYMVYITFCFHIVVYIYCRKLITQYRSVFMNFHQHIYLYNLCVF